MRHQMMAIVTALVVLCAFSTAFAAGDMAYVHSERIRIEYDGARDIDNQLQASVNDWKAQARDMETAIRALVAELESQQLLLSNEALMEKQQAIQEQQVAYESFLNDVWGVSGLAARREAELWQPAIERINVILQEIGSEGEYDMIFDAAMGSIVYAAPGTDLTQRVIDVLNGNTE